MEIKTRSIEIQTDLRQPSSDSSESSKSSAEDSLTPSAKMWLVVLSRLGEAYPPPGSRIGEMTSEARASMAATWSDELGDVPPAAILQLHSRVMKSRKAPYCPNVGDYRAAWNEWDYWREINEPEPTPHLALPEAMGQRDLPMFMQMFRDYGPVMCKCPETLCANGRYWYPSVARLVTKEEIEMTPHSYGKRIAKAKPGTRYWICAEGRCDFIWDAAQLNYRPGCDQPRARVADILGGRLVTERAVPMAEAASLDAVADNQLSDAEVIELLTACGFPVEAKGAARSLAFGRYVIAQIGATGLNERDTRTLWTEFKALPVESDGRFRKPAGEEI